MKTFEFNDGTYSDEVLNEAMLREINNSTAVIIWTWNITTTNMRTNTSTTITMSPDQIQAGTLKFENSISPSSNFPMQTLNIGQMNFTIFDETQQYIDLAFNLGDMITDIFMSVDFQYNGNTYSAGWTLPNYHISSTKRTDYTISITALDPVDYLNQTCTLAQGSVDDILTEIETSVFGGSPLVGTAEVGGDYPSTRYLSPDNDPTQIWDIPSGLTWRQLLLMMVPDGKYFHYEMADDGSDWCLVPASWGHLTNLPDSLTPNALEVTSQYYLNHGDYISYIAYEMRNASGEALWTYGASGLSDLRKFVSQTYPEFYGGTEAELPAYLEQYLQDNVHLFPRYTIGEVSAVENPLIEVGDYIEVSHLDTYAMYAMQVRYTFGGATQVVSTAPSSSAYNGAVTQAEALTRSVEARLSDQIADASATAEGNAKDYTDAQLANYTTDRLTSSNTTYTFQMQSDGNAVLYNGGTAVWSTNGDITWRGHQDEAPQRLYTTDTASTQVASGTSTFTNVGSFTVPTSGWYLAVLMQYINLTPSSGHFAMRIVDADSRNHTGYLSFRGSAGGGSLFLNFIGRFVAGTTYYIKAVNTTNTNWTINRTLGDAELMLQYLHRNV